MKKKLNLTWYIYNDEIDYEDRYCHNCGKKVMFKDSLKRRQNANGKNIFYFAIYKCPKGHTWNKQICTFKALSGLENNSEEHKYFESKYDELSMYELRKEKINEVEILIDKLHKKIRLDKFLSSKITDVSRSKIVKLINKGFIRVNNNVVKSNVNLKEKNSITLLIDRIKE